MRPARAPNGRSMDQTISPPGRVTAPKPDRIRGLAAPSAWALAARLGLPLLLVGCQYIQKGWSALQDLESKPHASGDKGSAPLAAKTASPLPRGSYQPEDALPDTPSLSVHHARFRPQDSVYAVLDANGVPRTNIIEILRVSRPVRALSRIRAGNRYELAVSEGAVHRFLVQVDDERQLRVYRTKKGALRARMERIPYATENVCIKLKVQGSLFGSISRAGVPLSLAVKLGEIFEWVVDFHKDINEGDTVELLVEDRSLFGRPAGFGRILAARIKTRRIEQAAIYFRSGNDSYFTPNGETLRRAFLRSPLKYTRISSRFTRKRFHPVLKRFRPHLGVDYAAPKGTPVRAVADGVVTFSGWRGAAGKMVQVRHGRGYATSYLHLSRIKRRARRGRKIRQGQIIGLVGSTGLSTGPHLDFRIKRNGTPMNPLSARLPAGNPVPGRRLREFRRLAKSRIAQLKSVPLLAVAADMASARSPQPAF